MRPPTKRLIADFKFRPTSAPPVRQGPLQLIRTCPTCSSRQHQSYDEPNQQNQDGRNDYYDESMSMIKSYENLLLKRKIPLCPYLSVQYHPGQFDLLKANLSSGPPSCVLYVVAINDLKDLYYFKQVLDYVHMTPEPVTITTKKKTLLDIKERAIVIPLRYTTCSGQTKGELFNVRDVADIIEPLVDKCQFESGYDLRIVPAVITKDHNKNLIPALGSLCIQVHEPYSVQSYLRMVNSSHPSDHIARHILHDIATQIPLLPTHIIAFIILNLDRELGPTFDDLLEYFKWFDKNRMGLNLHFAFTGGAESIVRFALLVLKDFISAKGDNYRITNIEALIAYANAVLPNIAPLSLLARAVLSANNACEHDEVMLKFEPDHKVRVLKDVTMDTFLGFTEEMESLIAFVRPCDKLEEFVERTLDNIKTHFRFFRVEIPMRFKRDNARMRWGFDIEEDEIYREAQLNNPIFKDWINVTQRDYRLDQLNLFVNAIEPLSYPSGDCAPIDDES